MFQVKFRPTHIPPKKYDPIAFADATNYKSWDAEAMAFKRRADARAHQSARQKEANEHQLGSIYYIKDIREQKTQRTYETGEVTYEVDARSKSLLSGAKGHWFSDHEPFKTRAKAREYVKREAASQAMFEFRIRKVVKSA